MTAQPLGAILAGGLSRRFGSDKARASIGGRAMLDVVAERLRPQCAAVTVIGRDWLGLETVPDRPHAGLGPLGGLAGALTYARANGFETVLTSGCDLPDLPLDLTALLEGPDAVFADQPTIGWWRANRAEPLVAWLARTERRSIRAWAADAGARMVGTPRIANVNRPEDLAGIRP